MLCTAVPIQFKLPLFEVICWFVSNNRIFKAGFKLSPITATASSIAWLRTECSKLRLVIKMEVYLPERRQALMTSFWTLRPLMQFSEGPIPFGQMLSWVTGWSAFNRISLETLLLFLVALVRFTKPRKIKGTQCLQPLWIRQDITD